MSVTPVAKNKSAAFFRFAFHPYFPLVLPENLCAQVQPDPKTGDMRRVGALVSRR